MKKLFGLIALAAMLVPAYSFATVISSGDVSQGGVYSGSVNSSNAWIASNALDGDAVNFWTFTASANAWLSVIVNSPGIEFGVSVYRGVVDDLELLFAGFNNAGDFGDNAFVGGTHPVTGAIGTSLDLVLPQSGTYTIAVGGESGFDIPGNFAYTMKVVVPEPTTLGLVAVALLAMALGMRRKT